MGLLVDIGDLDKAKVLTVLYNFARRNDGYEQVAGKSPPLGVDEARRYVNSGRTWFGYLNGRALRVQIGGDLLDPEEYDSLNDRPGLAADAVDWLRRTGTTVCEDPPDGAVIIDITGLMPAAVLVGLFKAAQLAPGAADACYRNGSAKLIGELTLEEAAWRLDQNPIITHLGGRWIGADLSDPDQLDATLYERTNGPGTAGRAIRRLRDDAAANTSLRALDRTIEVELTRWSRRGWVLGRSNGRGQARTPRNRLVVASFMAVTPAFKIGPIGLGRSALIDDSFWLTFERTRRNFWNDPVAQAVGNAINDRLARTAIADYLGGDAAPQQLRGLYERPGESQRLAREVKLGGSRPDVGAIPPRDRLDDLLDVADGVETEPITILSARRAMNRWFTHDRALGATWQTSSNPRLDGHTPLFMMEFEQQPAKVLRLFANTILNRLNKTS